MTVPAKRLTVIFTAIACLLLLPLIAMQFTTEVNWTLLDFTVAAVLLSGTAALCELVVRKVRSTRQRILLCAVILAGLVLTWLELAVGIFPSPVTVNTGFQSCKRAVSLIKDQNSLIPQLMAPLSPDWRMYFIIAGFYCTVGLV